MGDFIKEWQKCVMQFFVEFYCRVWCEKKSDPCFRAEKSMKSCHIFTKSLIFAHKLKYFLINISITTSHNKMQRITMSRNESHRVATSHNDLQWAERELEKNMAVWKCMTGFFSIRLYLVFSYVEVQDCKHHNKKT